MRLRQTEIGRKLAAAGLAVYLVLVLGLTLLAFPQDHPSPNLVPLRSMIRDLQGQGYPFVVNFLGNLGVFAPFGILLPVVRRGKTTAGQVARWGFLLSAGIELAQYGSGRRVADVDDVLLNVAGGLLGYVAVRVAAEVARLARKRTSQAIGQATT